MDDVLPQAAEGRILAWAVVMVESFRRIERPGHGEVVYYAVYYIQNMRIKIEKTVDKEK